MIIISLCFNIHFRVLSGKDRKKSLYMKVLDGKMGRMALDPAAEGRLPLYCGLLSRSQMRSPFMEFSR